jgi:hypothetical protein
MRREVVVVDRRRIGAIRKDRPDNRRLLQIVVERMGVDLVAETVVDHQVRPDAPRVLDVA